MCFLSNNVYDYYIVSQGKITVPGIDDGEDLTLADVSFLFKHSSCQLTCQPFRSDATKTFCNPPFDRRTFVIRLYLNFHMR